MTVANSSSSPDAIPLRRWIIGRAPDCDLIVSQPEVSGHHCCLVKTSDGFFLEDLQSSNGTLVNGVRISARTRITRNDRITLGQKVIMPWPEEQWKVGSGEESAVRSFVSEPQYRRQDIKQESGVKSQESPPTTCRRTVTIGRAPDNDVVLDYPMISAYHARLIVEGDQVWLEDLGSANGTAIGRPDRRIRQALLAKNDVVFFGSFHIPAARLLEGRLALGEQPCRTLTMTSQSLVFGRDPACEQVLDSPTISWRHARLIQVRGKLVLQDLGSANGTFLNGRRLRRAAEVKVGDVIGVGSYTFKLTDAGKGLLEKRDYQGNVALEARNVTVEVHGKRLVEGASFTVFPSEMIGIMGHSGVGKTTLLNALNGYLRPREGMVLINGQDLYAHYAQFAAHIGYVPQDDIVHRDLTVGQALYYAARLRLPADYRRADISARIGKVVRQLGLEGTENLRIGSPEKRGISGGQRKRVNLAMELITDPLVLFLDEPTSGLSSVDAWSVMKVLRELADAGKTILLTIHQPNLKVFQLLDNLALIARDESPLGPGKIVYYGPAYPDAINFFYPYGAHDSHASEPSPDDILGGLAKHRVEEWGKRFAASQYFRDYVEDRAGKHIPARMPQKPEGHDGLFDWRQWLTLTSRCLAIKLKDLWYTAILLAQAPIIAAMIVLVWGKQVSEEVTPENYAFNVRALAATLFVCSFAGLWFGCSNAVREIIGEWAVYRRERMVILNIGPYVASKFTVLTFLCLFQCAVLFALVRTGCALQGPWWPMLGIMLLGSLCGVAIGMAISAASRSTEMAIALVPVAMIAMLILGGMVQPLQRMHEVTRWVCAAMPSRWVFEGMLVLEGESRPVYRLPDQKAADAEPMDLAEPYFPTSKEENLRLGPEVAGFVLEIQLFLLVTAVALILRWRDLH